MSDFFRRQAADGGENGIWADFEEDQNAPARSINTLVFYNNAGALYRKPGKVGLDNGSNKGVITFASDVGPISLAGLTASRWAEVVVSVVGTAPSMTLFSIGTGTDPATIPAAFLAEAEYAKMGFYRSGTARTLALVWINAAGNLEGIVNMLDGIAYAGYSISDDARDRVFYHNYQKYNIPANVTRHYPQTGVFTAAGADAREVYPVTTAAASFAANIPALATWAGRRIKIIKVDTGAGVVTVTPNGAETFFPGATSFPLRKIGDVIELESDGLLITVVDSLATLDSEALAVNQLQNLPHGTAVRPSKMTVSLVCLTAEFNYAVNDEVFVFPQSITTRFWGVCADATNIITNTEATSAIAVLDKTVAGAGRIITMASWKIRARYSL
jgi:hypothetical protein